MMSYDDQFTPTGSPEMDDDHLKLIAALRTVPIDQHAILRDLQEHFVHESMLMAQISYSGRARHEAAHQKALEIAARTMEQSRPVEWAAEMLRWLLDHQLAEDVLLGVALSRARREGR